MYQNLHLFNSLNQKFYNNKIEAYEQSRTINHDCRLDLKEILADPRSSGAVALQSRIFLVPDNSHEATSSASLGAGNEWTQPIPR